MSVTPSVRNASASVALLTRPYLIFLVTARPVKFTFQRQTGLTATILRDTGRRLVGHRIILVNALRNIEWRKACCLFCPKAFLKIKRFLCFYFVMLQGYRVMECQFGVVCFCEEVSCFSETFVELISENRPSSPVINAS